MITARKLTILLGAIVIDAKQACIIIDCFLSPYSLRAHRRCISPAVKVPPKCFIANMRDSEKQNLKRQLWEILL